MSVPTKQVRMKGFPDPVTINAEDFDEKIHTEVGDANSTAAPNPELRGKLPDEFPGKAALEAAGFDTYAKVRRVIKSGEKVQGVADATTAKIKEALAAKPEAEDEA